MKMLLLYVILIDIAYLNRVRLEKSQENYMVKASSTAKSFIRIKPIKDQTPHFSTLFLDQTETKNQP